MVAAVRLALKGRTPTVVFVVRKSEEIGVRVTEKLLEGGQSHRTKFSLTLTPVQSPRSKFSLTLTPIRPPNSPPPPRTPPP